MGISLKRREYIVQEMFVCKQTPQWRQKIRADKTENKLIGITMSSINIGKMDAHSMGASRFSTPRL